jgi:hypothetical protein
LLDNINTFVPEWDENRRKIALPTNFFNSIYSTNRIRLKTNAKDLGKILLNGKIKI